jgi:phosphoribosylamine-glycine ligase
MNKTRKTSKGLNAKKICLKGLNSKKMKNGLRNMGLTLNVKKLKKNKPFMKEFMNKCTKKLKEMFRA